jgi:hypothetical protein
MFPYLIYFIKKYYKLCTLKSICKFIAETNCITVLHKSVSFLSTLTIHSTLVNTYVIEFTHSEFNMTCRYKLVSFLFVINFQAPEFLFFPLPTTFHFAWEANRNFSPYLFSFAFVDVKPVTNSSCRFTIDSESSFQRVHMSGPELHSRNTSDEIHVIYLFTRRPAISNVTYRRER